MRLNQKSAISNKFLFYFFFRLYAIFSKKKFNWRLITLQYCGGFCHTFTWISHRCTCVPYPDPSHPIPNGHPSAPALSSLSHALNLNWQSVSHMIIYMFQWKNKLLIKFSIFYDLNSPESEHRGNSPQHNKGCRWQAGVNIIFNSKKLKAFPLRL